MSKPSVTRPGRTAETPKTVSAVTKAVDNDEKQLKAFVPAKYHVGTTDIKNMSANSTPVKYLIIEALDDLLKKYHAGEGRYEIGDQVELTRRLESLI